MEFTEEIMFSRVKILAGQVRKSEVFVRVDVRLEYWEGV